MPFEPVAVTTFLEERETSLAGQVLRTTIAAVASYVAALWLTPNSQPILAPLTALLVVQVTLYATLTTGVRRVASVVSGVVVAVLFSEAVGLNWWSLTLLLLASLGLGHVIRLKDSVAEVAISAMIVLGVSQVAETAWGRIVETLIGAIVGMLFSIVLAPPVHLRPATDAVRSVTDELGNLLNDMAAGVGQGATHAKTLGWLEEARRVDRDVVRVDATLSTAEEGLRLNPRGRRALHQTLVLRSGLDTVEISAVALRGVCRSLTYLYREEEGSVPVPIETERALRAMFHSLGTMMTVFGRLLALQNRDPLHEIERIEAELGSHQADAEREREIAEEVLLRETRNNPHRWELYGALLGAVDRLIEETRAVSSVRAFATHEVTHSTRHHVQRPRTGRSRRPVSWVTRPATWMGRTPRTQ